MQRKAWGGGAGAGPAARWPAEQTVRAARWRRQALPRWRGDPAGSGVGVAEPARAGRGREAAPRRRRCSGSWRVTGDAWSEALHGWQRDVRARRRAELRCARAQAAAIPRRARPIRPGLVWLDLDGDGTLSGCGFGRFCARGGRAASSAPCRRGHGPRTPRAATAERLRRRSADHVRAGHDGYYAGKC